MLNKALFIISFCAFAAPVFAERAIQNQDMVNGSSQDSTVANDEWVNLGCFAGSQDCHHEAHDHGYHHSTVRYDRHCAQHDHHRPYACYGRN